MFTASSENHPRSNSDVGSHSTRTSAWSLNLLTHLPACLWNGAWVSTSPLSWRRTGVAKGREFSASSCSVTFSTHLRIQQLCLCIRSRLPCNEKRGFGRLAVLTIQCVAMHRVQIFWYGVVKYSALDFYHYGRRASMYYPSKISTVCNNCVT